MLRPHQAQPHLRALLRRQQQRDPEETPEHGGQDLRLSMRVGGRLRAGRSESTNSAETVHAGKQVGR